MPLPPRTWCPPKTWSCSYTNATFPCLRGRPDRRDDRVFRVAASDGSVYDPRYDDRLHDHRMPDNRRNGGRSNNQVYRDDGRGYPNDQRYGNGRHHAIDGSSRPAGRGVAERGLGVGGGASMERRRAQSTPSYDGQWRGEESRVASAIGPERDGLQMGAFSPIEGCWLLIDRARKTNLPEVGDVLLLLIFSRSGYDSIGNAVLHSLSTRYVLAPPCLVLHSHRCELVARKARVQR